jgi:hypothetical protein
MAHEGAVLTSALRARTDRLPGPKFRPLLRSCSMLTSEVPVFEPSLGLAQRRLNKTALSGSAASPSPSARSATTRPSARRLLKSQYDSAVRRSGCRRYGDRVVMFAFGPADNALICRGSLADDVLSGGRGIGTALMPRCAVHGPSRA